MNLRTFLVVAMCLAYACSAVAQENSSPSAAGEATHRDNVVEVHFKLQLLAQAFQSHQYHRKQLPPPRDRDGNVDGAGLSWRVHLLPFVGEPDLYEAFHFDEPWDSEHNQRHLDRMPEIYRLGAEAGSKTRIQVFAGKDAYIGFGGTRDGVSNTILLAVAGVDRGVPWTKPVDLAFEADDPRPALGKLPSGNLECVMADGRLLTVRANVDANTLAALVTANGGEVVDANKLRASGMPAAGGLLSGLQNLLGGRSKQPDQTQRQLKSIGLAIMEYHDTFRRYPVAKREDNHFDAEGHPKLSWRVHLLIFMQQEPLYKKFRLNEPWDSPHNKPLLKFMPQAYRSAGDPADSTTTRMQTIVGDNTLYDPALTPRIADVRDGTSNTLLVIVVGADKAVPWTKPEDAYFDPAQPLACLGTIPKQGVPFVKLDGEVRVFRPNLLPAVFSAMVTPRGGEVFGGQQYRDSVFPRN